MKDDKKQEARRRADRLRAFYEEQGEPLKWFDALYREAEGDAGYIPWGHQTAREPLLIWLERFHRNNPGKSGLKALDVGCGLGDNAAALAQAGFQVTAFDISPTAVNWAQARFADTSIQFEVADIFDLPERWHGQFDVVAETFTIQALKGQMRLEAIKALSRLVKPEGRLVVVCRGRLDDEPFAPPPWPLTPKELSQVEQFGFNALPLESFFDKKEPPQRLFLADYIKDTANAAEIDGKG